MDFFSQRCFFITRLGLLAVSLCVLCGCETYFQAVPTDPRKNARVEKWEPGEITEPTRTRLAHLQPSWKKSPASAAQALAVGSSLADRRALVELCLWQAARESRWWKNSKQVAGWLLAAVEYSRGVSSGADAVFFTKTERFATSRLAEIELPSWPGESEVVVQGPVHPYAVRLAHHGIGVIAPALLDKVRGVDRFQLKGPGLHVAPAGVGTPLVGWRKGEDRWDAAELGESSDGSILPLTATLDFLRHESPQKPRKVAVTLHDRSAVERVRMDGRSQPLAGDFTTALGAGARGLQHNRFLLGLLGFMRGDEYFRAAGIRYFGEPRADKEAVIFTHGLISHPDDWRFIINELLADPKLRQRYQFWTFEYPTSLPVPWSGDLLRTNLAAVDQRMRRTTGHTPPITLVGHSMGGLVNRLQSVRGGDDFWREYFRVPPEKLHVSKDSADTVRGLFYFEPNPAVRRQIFLCVPHRGSELASSFIGDVARTVARLPVQVVATTTDILTLDRQAMLMELTHADRWTSIGSLHPRNQFMRALPKLPWKRGIELHSVVGDRGRGDSPNSDDGAVAYWSSAIPEAGKPTILPAWHAVLGRKDTAEEVGRLLRAR